MKKTVLIFTMVFALFACDDNISENNQEEIVYEAIQQGFLSGDNMTSNSQNSVITDQNNWNQLVSLLTSENYDLSSVNIDFNTHCVLYIKDEARPKGGYSISVQNVYEGTNTIDVHITKSFSDSPNMDMPTQPFYIAKMPKTNKSIIFL